MTAGPRRSPPARDAARLGFANGAGARVGAPLTLPASGIEARPGEGAVYSWHDPRFREMAQLPQSPSVGVVTPEVNSGLSSPDSIVTKDASGFPRNSASLVRGSLPAGGGDQAQGEPLLLK